MTTGPSSREFYITGGTMSPDADSYVVRAADEELFRAVEAGEYCYVLTTRQMGKSSLMARTAQQLAGVGVRSAQVTLETIRESDSAATPAQFLYGIAHRIHNELGLTTKLSDWWKERELLSATLRFYEYLTQELLERVESPVAVFIDEIDSTIGLSFKDDFFATLRACHNARASNPDLNRLTFILLGVATPAQLIADATRTPFNIGKGIELADFTIHEAECLARGFPGSERRQRTLLERVFYWTGGHPYLTQTTCRAIAAQIRSTDKAEDSSADFLTTIVDHVVRRLFLTSEAAREEHNLRFVRSRLTLGDDDLRSLLRTYENVLTGKIVEDNPASSMYASLKLAGVVRVTGEGRLQVRNRIYESVFGRDWVRQELPPDSAATQRAETAHPLQAATENPLRITVTNGDLTFEREALLIGHYHATRLTGTERLVNNLIGGAMEQSLEVGLYPVSVGSHQIFINTRPNLERGTFMPRPKAVIVVGLGDEGKLQAADLARTVRQAVIAWAQRLAEDKRQAPAFFELATTLIGSGGMGVSAGEAARLIAQGVSEANTVLQYERRRVAWPQVSHLHFIELYSDRATEAWRALRMRAAASPGRYAIGDTVQMGIGPLRHPPQSGYRGADYDFLIVKTEEERGGEPVISYTLDTRRAHSEVRGHCAQSAVLRDLIATASNDQNRDQQIGRMLFNLLIPVELEPYMAGSDEMQMSLEAGTAAIPWELLETTGDSDPDQKPWAIRVKLLRKLQTKRFREQVVDADADACVLVIGEPECPEEYPRLPGARSEAIAVRTCLTQRDALDPNLVEALISADATEVGSNARTVVNALFEKPWRILHIAGHGVPPSKGKSGGVVLSNGSFLGPDEISNIRAVPELVFVNCCHLASGDADELLRYDRAEFASSVAGALIEIGVRCVIAAGWAVDDDAASLFADAFYSSLLRGNRFIVAVGDARTAAYERRPDVNTWAAYQCYGDPDWVFRRKVLGADQFAAISWEDFAGIDSATSLQLALERIIVQTKYQGADLLTQLSSLQQLEKRFGETWGKSGAVAELFGQAFVEAGAVESGMHWYDRAVAAPDGRASMKAPVQLANVRCRLAWEIVSRAHGHLVEMRNREKAGGRSKANVAARRERADAERSLRKAVERADELINQALASLIKLEQTIERDSLVGSAFKRRALVAAAAGRRQRVRKDLEQMKAHYQHALVIGANNGALDLSYAASNCLAADVALNAGTRRWRGLDPVTVEIVQKSLKDRGGRDADFWSVVGEIELRQYEALAKRKLASARKELDKAYQDLHRHVTATRMWGSVYDTACLVLPNYADRVTGKEKTAATELLAQLRTFAHPVAEQ